MIKRLINNGFKDQTRSLALSGLDLFTSDDVNGVGKSAVLEAFKLALVGEIPGRAKNVDDILQFTSLDEIKVEILADTYRGPVNVERRFLRFAPRGEKRPVCIHGVDKKYEEGSGWVRRHVGAVSISFDPFEFLNLPNAKKRQWIIAHSPESVGPGLTALRVLMFARMVEALLGTGIVRSVLKSLGSASLEEFCKESDAKNLSNLQDRLMEVLCQQEPGLSALVAKTQDAIFRYWSASCSEEENSNAMLRHLKSEILRLKNAVRDQAAALSCMGPVSLEADVTGKDPGICDCRRDIQNLNARIEALDKQMVKRRNQKAAKTKRDLRIIFLKENISRLIEKLNPEMNQALQSLREQLHQKRVDPESLQDKLKKLNRESSRFSADCQDREFHLKQLASQIKLKRDQLETIGSSHFNCPVASEIRCDTDMAPYRKILAGGIESLQRQEKDARRFFETAQQKVTVCQSEIDRVDLKLSDLLAVNREIQREIDLVEEQIQAEEMETAKVRGQLMAYREEMNALEAEPEPLSEGSVATLEDEKSDLKRQRVEKQKTLDEWLRCQGKIETLNLLKRQKKLWEQELGIVKQMFDLMGGVQEEMASRIAGALETEVNDVLKLIDGDYHFTLNLKGRDFEMGWNRDGKIIPFKTINSAHFVIFIVPFLAALIQRLARTREKTGLPTLKALCIEAESLTPANLSALLKGLAKMKAKGVFDNVLVAHYHSFRDPDKLSGFQEHVLEKTAPPVEAISL
jgi:DNA repair exonuclease SbcCD ATPase subunit